MLIRSADRSHYLFRAPFGSTRFGVLFARLGVCAMNVQLSSIEKTWEQHADGISCDDLVDVSANRSNFHSQLRVLVTFLRGDGTLHESTLSEV